MTEARDAHPTHTVILTKVRIQSHELRRL